MVALSKPTQVLHALKKNTNLIRQVVSQKWERKTKKKIKGKEKRKQS